MNDYYVYIYWRLDTNEPFYVGKGHNDRWRALGKTRRNQHFLNIVNKHPIAVEIVRNNLTEEQANDIECWIINELVFEYGFSIDMPNNRSKEKGSHLVNMTWGGDGVVGCNVWKDKTDEEKREWGRRISESNKGKFSGKNNPMYGKNPWGNMTEKQKEEAKRKISEANKGRPITKKQIERLCKFNHEREWTEEQRRKVGKANSGKNNGNAISVICLTTKRIFYTLSEGARYYGCDVSRIFKCCKGYTYHKGKKEVVKSCGKLPDGTKLVWKFLIWNHNKKYRIKNN